MIILVGVDVITLITKSIKPLYQNEAYSGFADCPACDKPNIYLIITDEYAGRTELQDLFAYDNSAFENELKRRGFFVVQNPMSNYNYTPYSMASIFTMNYLKGISDKSSDINNRNIIYTVINKNELTDILKRLGYDFVNLSLFDFAGLPSRLNNNEFYSTREKIISSQTLTGRIKKDLWYHLITTFKFGWAQKRLNQKLVNNIHYQFNATLKAGGEMQTAQPRFIYTHFIMPHYPYLFDKNGKELSFEESVQGWRKDLYIGYLQYCNKLCLSFVDSILKKEKTNPIIVLMSDHGFTKYGAAINPSYNFKNMINIFFPDKNYIKLPDTISAINVFRIILNERFKQQLPLLKDSTVFLQE